MVLCCVRHPPKSEEKTSRETETEGPGPPTYLISFSESASSEVLQYITKQLQAQGLQCQLFHNGSIPYLTISAGFQVLAKQVSNLRNKILDWKKLAVML